MEDAIFISRLQFAFTIVYHYLFPQLTMGLALLLVVLKTLYLRRGDETYNKALRFWGRIFAITFVVGVVTGIPMEFQFGTNWAAFSAFAGDIIAQTWPWRAPSPSSSSRPSLGSSCSASAASARGCTGSQCSCSSLGPGLRPTSSWRPTPGCRTP